MPVNTSPEPAVARAELPLVLTKHLPSGEATTVGAPFKTRITFHSLASSIAMSILFLFIYPTFFPVNLESSPGCGVRIRVGCFFLRSLLFKLFNPSASIIMGFSELSIIFIISSLVSLWIPIPGPNANTSIFSIHLSSTPTAELANVCELVSGSGIVTTSVTFSSSI